MLLILHSLKKEVLAYSYYFGFKKIVWKGLFPVIRIAHKTLRKFLKGNTDIKFPLDIHTIKFEYLSAVARTEPEKNLKKLSKLASLLSDQDLKSSCQALMKNITTYCKHYHQ
jgi:hypothetical protein